MENKVLIKLDVPYLDNTFDIFVPVNEVIWKITNLSYSGSCELSGFGASNSQKMVFINKLTNEIYSPNSTIIDSSIRNGTELLLLIV